MTTRIAVLVVVTFVSACGAGARPPAASSPALAEPVAQSAAEQGPGDDYVVGPFETSSAGVRTYYIVRN